MNLSQFKKLDSSGELLVDFGPQPVSNRFLPADGSAEAPSFPLQLRLCPETGLIHLGGTFPVEALKPRYNWLTCFEPEDHLDDLVETILELPGITRESVFGAYSFKDDTTLARLRARGFNQTWRIDPQQDLNISDACANVETFQAAFTPDSAFAIRQRCGAADVMIVRHVIEHAYNLPDFIQAVRNLLKPGGYIVWELPDCEVALSRGDCTTVWEEHVFYFTCATFKQVLQASQLPIVHFESVLPYALENSIIAIVREPLEGLPPVVVEPREIDLEIARAREFAVSVEQRRRVIRAKLESITREYGPIALFGAGHLAVAFISLLQVDDLIACLVDDNPHKKGMRMPVGDLTIMGSEALYSQGIRMCLLSLNPQNHSKVIANHRRFVEQGGIFASIFPGSEHYLEQLHDSNT